MHRSTSFTALVAGACLAGSALAQAPAASAPAPSWQQGRSPDQAASTLHPFAPILTGRPASKLPLDKLKVPAGFKVEVWADGIPEARSLALGDKGTVFVSNRNLKDVYAVVDQGGKRDGHQGAEGPGTRRTASRSRTARSTSPSGTASPPTTASRTSSPDRRRGAS